MKNGLLIFLFSFNFLIGFSQKESSINFTIRNLGINVDGHFNTFSITPEFKNEKLTSISAKITVASIKTGIDSRDEHLLKEDYFDVNKHSVILLKSTDVTTKLGKAYTVKAKLTIKGKTKLITIVINIEKTDDGYKITSSFEINRKDFNVGGGSLILSKTVKADIIYYHKL